MCAKFESVRLAGMIDRLVERGHTGIILRNNYDIIVLLSTPIYLPLIRSGR